MLQTVRGSLGLIGNVFVIHGAQKMRTGGIKTTEALMNESKKRGPRRSSESEQAILEATLQLLKEKPLRDISIEAIAAKACVGKMTIYKWWPSRAYVALDAMSKDLTKTIPVPDTGDTKRDLEELLGSAISFFSGKKGKILGQFLA